jgi:hypothetical protein
LWHARVLRAEPHAARSPGGIVFDAMGDPFLPRRRASSVRVLRHFAVHLPLLSDAKRSQVTRVLLGDASGARLQMEVPLVPEHGDVRVRCGALSVAVCATVVR